MHTLKNRLYYRLKPYVPWRLRMAIRQASAKGIRRDCADTWPIAESARQLPEDWTGWPEKQNFAVVLTHDVEGHIGLGKCRQLAAVEKEFGFRSSFNFIPEGEYRVSDALRAELAADGFEIGVHDRFHDGMLYASRASFREHAKAINRHLSAWGAVGYRSGFMLHNFDWHHDLDILYDASSFDTDPFEPQPDGTGTIFPFWVPNPNYVAPSSPGSAVANSSAFPPREGYVELPYTLPQDSTLFLLLRERSAAIWLNKLDWIAQNRGMALVGVHPDYIQFEGENPTPSSFPVEYYRTLLAHIRDRYAGQYWQPLPRDMAKFVREQRRALVRQPIPPSIVIGTGRRKKIWIDLENTPHIPFFAPIIRELEKRNYQVVLSARDAYQTCEMADLYHFKYTRIGRHFGQKMALKALGLGIRSTQLVPFALRERPVLALNHGSRSQVVTCNLLGIPSVTIMDYEHSRGVGLGHPTWMIVPQMLTHGAMGAEGNTNLRYYSGIKEDVYARELVPDPNILPRLGLDATVDVVATVRPPATEAHYHNPESDVLFASFMERAVRTPDVKVVLLPRNKRQEAQIRSHWPHWFAHARVVIPDHVVDGLNLLWHSDLVVSGGGTMNREAAALGLPVYSIFRGRTGAVDQHLQSEGRLCLIESVADVENKILLQRRKRHAHPAAEPSKTLSDIIAHLEAILAQSSA